MLLVRSSQFPAHVVLILNLGNVDAEDDYNDLQYRDDVHLVDLCRSAIVESSNHVIEEEECECCDDTASSNNTEVGLV